LYAGKDETSLGGMLSLGPPVGATCCPHPESIMLKTTPSKTTVKQLLTAIFIILMQI
jgi:hypothetical protein